MKKRTIFALSFAIVFPLICFFIVKYFSDKNVVLPPRYFYDDVIVENKNGKKVSDTIWHSISNFKLYNQLGKVASWEKYGDKIVVVDFFFTRCGSFCPKLTKNMKILQDNFLSKKEIVQFVSFSVDPNYDSINVLKKYADLYQINHTNWDLLTGSKDFIYSMAKNEFKVGVEEDETGNINFVHTDKFILLDKHRVVRGFYSGQDSLDIRRLAEDIVFLSLEKDRK